MNDQPDSAVSIRTPEPEDWTEFKGLVEKSKELHERFVTPPQLEEVFKSTYLANADTDTEKRYLIVEDGQIAGSVSVSQIF